MPNVVQGLSQRDACERAREVIGLLGLEDQTSQRARDLSGRQRRRPHTGIALMHRSCVVFLDEPPAGGTGIEASHEAARKAVSDAAPSQLGALGRLLAPLTDDAGRWSMKGQFLIGLQALLGDWQR